MTRAEERKANLAAERALFWDALATTLCSSRERTVAVVVEWDLQFDQRRIVFGDGSKVLVDLCHGRLGWEAIVAAMTRTIARRRSVRIVPATAERVLVELRILRERAARTRSST